MNPRIWATLQAEGLIYYFFLTTANDNISLGLSRRNTGQYQACIWKSNLPTIPFAVRDTDTENTSENRQSKFKIYLTEEEYLSSCAGKSSKEDI